MAEMRYKEANSLAHRLPTLAEMCEGSRLEGSQCCFEVLVVLTLLVGSTRHNLGTWEMFSAYTLHFQQHYKTQADCSCIGANLQLAVEDLF